MLLKQNKEELARTAADESRGAYCSNLVLYEFLESHSVEILYT